MERFGQFYLDKEKDIVVELSMESERLHYLLRTPNHNSGNLAMWTGKTGGFISSAWATRRSRTSSPTAAWR